MQESLLPFSSDSALAEACREYAHEAVAWAGKRGVCLDYSGESFRLVEDVLDHLNQSFARSEVTPDEVVELARLLGSYLGEIHRRCHGRAEWFVSDLPGVETAALCVAGVGELYPWKVAHDRITRGNDHDLIALSQLQPPFPPHDALPLDPQDLRSLRKHAADPDRLYPILSHKYYGFYAGQLGYGRQALITRGRDGLCVHLFDAGGNLLTVERRLPNLLRGAEEKYMDINDEELHEYLAAEFGFRAELIKVKQFDHPDAEVVLDPLPSHYVDFLDDPTDRSFSDEDRREYPHLIRRWFTNEEFVLYYGNDYWLNRDGEVTSS